MLLSPRTKVTKAKLGGKAFQFNPEAFTDNQSVRYTEISSAGISYPLIGYAGGAQRTLSFTIYMNDRFQRNATQDFINHLNNFIPKANQRGANSFKAPPSIQFAFGRMVKDCYLSAMDITHSDFSPTLNTWEATINITLIVPQ